MKAKSNLLMLVLVVFIAGAITACSKKSDNSNVRVTINLGSYATAQNWLWDLVMPKAHAQVSSLKMCFKRLRFKTAEDDDSSTSGLSIDDADDNSEDNVDLNLGEVTVSSSSTSLGTVVIPAGEYRRIEFDLENDCASGKSLALSNRHGTYSSTDHIKIKFTGQFTADQDGVVTLGVQAILDQLNNYSGVGSLKDAAEAAGGTLAN